MEVVDAYKRYKALFVTQFEWGVFIWRPLTWDEVGLYEKLFLLAPHAKSDLEDKIFNECVVEHPLPVDDFDSWQAGIVTTVANQILKTSAATNPIEFLSRLEGIREVVNANVLYKIYAMLMRVFPYKLHELIELPLESILELIAMMEGITGEPLKIEIEQEAPEIGPVDFDAENIKLREVDSKRPEGDWNIHSQRCGSP